MTAQLSADRNGVELSNLVRATQGLAEKYTRVRYCWADSPLCNLYDEAGLPVGPFEIGITP